ncbi:MAG: hypothetical protein GX265_05095 [Mollicutes bacterium]|jgi:hypothetical protein|nr:hypothetical protein [Mollicutes bacterium]
MKAFSNVMLFALGAACGAGAYIGMESLNKNKYQVKKKINDTLSSMQSTLK